MQSEKGNLINWKERKRKTCFEGEDLKQMEKYIEAANFYFQKNKFTRKMGKWDELYESGSSF